MIDTIFRAWYPKENKMIMDAIELELLFLDKLNDYEHDPIYGIGFRANHEGRMVDMMMYSSWMDRKGSSICDGDILYDSDWCGTWYVEFTGLAFAVRGDNGLAIHYLRDLPQCDIEIIGNKYEGLNPSVTGKAKEKGDEILGKLTKADNGFIVATHTGLRVGKKWWQL